MKLNNCKSVILDYVYSDRFLVYFEILPSACIFSEEISELVSDGVTPQDGWMGTATQFIHLGNGAPRKDLSYLLLSGSDIRWSRKYSDSFLTFMFNCRSMNTIHSDQRTNFITYECYVMLQFDC